MGIWLSVMHPLLALSAIQLVTVSAAPNFSFPEKLEDLVTGITNGGDGKCIEKIVDITASAMNMMLKLIFPPISPWLLRLLLSSCVSLSNIPSYFKANFCCKEERNIILPLTEVNATLPSQVLGPKQNITDTYSISY
jgi:glucan phosphoethanolaminetransferase (alkaline phosphatase superfamily)